MVRRHLLCSLVVSFGLFAISCASDQDSGPSDDGAREETAPTTSNIAPGGSAITARPLTDLPPGVDASIGAVSVEVPIVLADGSTTDASFDALEAGPTDGELVLLLHGFPQSSYEWRDQLAALGRAGFHAVAFDQRGYSPGARPADDLDYAVPLLAGDVIGVADAFGADTFNVVGHDWGAAVAWALADIGPERVDSLTAVSVPHPSAYAEALENPEGDQSGKVGYIETFTAPEAAARFTVDGGEAFLRAAQAGVATSEDIEVYAGVLGTEEAMSAALAWYRATSLTAGSDLAATKVPTLFVWSDGDCCLGRDAAEATEHFVDAPYRFEILEGISHWVPEEAAGELTALILDHLAR